MGREYKTRIKEQYGKKAVVAYETLELGGTIAPAAAGPATLTDRQAIGSYTTKRNAKLDAITVQLSSALVTGSGTVRVRALVNGVAVGSGTVPAGLSRGDVTFETEKDAAVRLTPEDVLVVDVTKGATPIVQTLTARVALRLFEL